MKLHTNVKTLIDTPHYATEDHATWPWKLMQILRHCWTLHWMPQHLNIIWRIWKKTG